MKLLWLRIFLGVGLFTHYQAHGIAHENERFAVEENRTETIRALLEDYRKRDVSDFISVTNGNRIGIPPDINRFTFTNLPSWSKKVQLIRLLNKVISRSENEENGIDELNFYLKRNPKSEVSINLPKNYKFYSEFKRNIERFISTLELSPKNELKLKRRDKSCNSKTLTCDSNSSTNGNDTVEKVGNGSARNAHTRNRRHGHRTDRYRGGIHGGGRGYYGGGGGGYYNGGGGGYNGGGGGYNGGGGGGGYWGGGGGGGGGGGNGGCGGGGGGGGGGGVNGAPGKDCGCKGGNGGAGRPGAGGQGGAGGNGCGGNGGGGYGGGGFNRFGTYFNNNDTIFGNYGDPGILGFLIDKDGSGFTRDLIKPPKW